MNESGFTPLLNKVLVKPDKQIKKEQSVIQIPDSAEARYMASQSTGYVVAVGETAWRFDQKEYDMTVVPKVGDHVMYARFAGRNFKGRDESSYVVLNDEDITGFVEDFIIE